MPKQKSFEVDDSSLPGPRSLTFDEFGDPPPIELVSESDFIKAADLEAFMNEIITIRIPRSPIKGTLAIECPCVEGRNQPIVRGVPTKVRRTYVEVLAQSSAFNYDQVQPNPADLSIIENIETKTLAYPFEVIHDPSGEKGHAWLENILLNQ